MAFALSIALIIIAVAVLAAAIFLIAVAMKPAHFRITRTASIRALPHIVHANIDDFHRWNHWSPWANLDPAAKNTYDGSPSGTGAGFAWDGNAQVGAGHMTIVASSPTRITIRLDFRKPFKATNTAEFTLHSDGDHTHTTWAMTGTSPFLMKAMCMLFFDQDKVIGGMFEQGLANLKVLSEKVD